MKNFEHVFDEVSFKGNFRIYQQKILDESKNYIKDGKINIVAAPGSGKTILGLELIKRQNAPCIIFSPTTTIKNQWGERFEAMFLDSNQDLKNFVSYDLHTPNLLTSITYQALYSAVKRIKSQSDDEDVDNSDLDIFSLIKFYKIKTICLDESHHLKNEWQKALEVFISKLDKDIVIISLTATPPYDSTPAEWNRYIKVCGEIDEEIGVPELVSQKNLCPHQDYIYFNYPTEEEIQQFKVYKEKIYSTVDKICNSELFKKAVKSINESWQTSINVKNNAGDLSSFVSLCDYSGIELDAKLKSAIKKNTEIKSFNTTQASVAIQFVLDLDFVPSDCKDAIISELNKKSLYIENKVNFDLDEKLTKKLVSSAGKLKSIENIVISENDNLKSNLRMLVLTDYIRKETVNTVAKDVVYNEVNIVSIFETIRRTGVEKIGVISGSLIILPTGVKNNIQHLNIKFSFKEIENTNYSVFNIKVNNREKVAIISNLFEDGLIRILIGTKSLLGEGWDSPCINSIILSSFVGSFMLSNQMRGRAIRCYKNDLNKTANIWHLVTFEPEYSNESKSIDVNQTAVEITSKDYELIKRRFDCFVGPNYEKETIESGIGRVTILKPPFDKTGVEQINTKMLELSKNKQALIESWTRSTHKSAFLYSKTTIPSERKVSPLGFIDRLSLLIFTVLTTVIMALFISTFLLSSLKNFKHLTFMIFAVITIFATLTSIPLIKKLVKHISPKKSIETLSLCVLDTLQNMKLITKSAELSIKEDKKNKEISVIIKNAKIREQNIFNKSMNELLSPIDSPKYLLIKKNGNNFNYVYSFACPSIIAKKKENVKYLAKCLNSTTGNFEVVHVVNDYGDKMLENCKKFSYITRNSKGIKNSQTNDF